MSSFEQQVMNFLNVETNDIEELKTIIFERSAELLQRKKFMEEEQLEAQYQARMIIARAQERANQCMNNR